MAAHARAYGRDVSRPGVHRVVVTVEAGDLVLAGVDVVTVKDRLLRSVEPRGQRRPGTAGLDAVEDRVACPARGRRVLRGARRALPPGKRNAGEGGTNCEHNPAGDGHFGPRHPSLG